MFMVILNHVSDEILIKQSPNYIVYFYEGIGYCAVPLFLMLTGAFVVDKAIGVECRNFYFKAFKKFGIPTIIFTLIYWIYDFVIGKKNLQLIWASFMSGCHDYAHWYVYMLIGVYALIPLVSFVKSKVDGRVYTKAAILFFLWSVFSRLFESTSTSWSIGQSVTFLGFVLIGDWLKHKMNSKNNYFGIFLVLIGLLMLAIDFFILYKHVLSGGNYYFNYLNSRGAPLVVIACIIIFVGFSKFSVKWAPKLIVEKSFLIFLNHKMILDILEGSFFPYIERMLNYNLRILIPIEVCITFIPALIIAIVTDEILNRTVYKK